jgi:hypothetical protein
VLRVAYYTCISIHELTSVTRLIEYIQLVAEVILSLNKLPEDIRDECRSDPSVSRQVLVEIARKKTDKGMRTLFENYKRKREREVGERRRGVVSAVKYKSRFDKMTGFMETVKLDKLNQERRDSLKELIEELKTTADALLEKLESAPLPEEKPAGRHHGKNSVIGDN